MFIVPLLGFFYKDASFILKLKYINTLSPSLENKNKDAVVIDNQIDVWDINYNNAEKEILRTQSVKSNNACHLLRSKFN